MLVYLKFYCFTFFYFILLFLFINLIFFGGRAIYNNLPPFEKKAVFMKKLVTKIIVNPFKNKLFAKNDKHFLGGKVLNIIL